MARGNRRWVPTKSNTSKAAWLARWLLSVAMQSDIYGKEQRMVNPRVRGWTNYFRWGNSARDLSFVKWQVDRKVRRFASRQQSKKRKGGRGWTTWRSEEIYKEWGLYNDYRVSWSSVPKQLSLITLPSEVSW